MTDADQAKLIRALVGRRNVELLLEHHQHGRTHAELAAQHQITRQAITKRLALARAKLRDCGLWPLQWNREPQPVTPERATP